MPEVDMWPQVTISSLCPLEGPWNVPARFSRVVLPEHGRVVSASHLERALQRMEGFAGAAITKHHSLRGLTNRSLFSQTSGGWKAQIMVSTGLVASEVSVLGFGWRSPLCLYVVFPLHLPVSKFPLLISTPAILD